MFCFVLDASVGDHQRNRTIAIRGGKLRAGGGDRGRFVGSDNISTETRHSNSGEDHAEKPFIPGFV